MSIGKLEFVDSPQGTLPLEKVALRLNPIDDVAIVMVGLSAGTTLILDGDDGRQAEAKIRQFVPSGHKIALREMAPGTAVRRYGQIIGFTTTAVLPGEHVHLHNLGVQEFAREYAFSVDVRPVEYIAEAQRRTFLGYLRSDGRVGTRNYVAVIGTVNCSAHTVREIAHHFTPERLAAYPNIDGVIPIAHHLGCASRIGSQDYVFLQRCLAGIACHPNVAGYIVVGLGCETNQGMDLVQNFDLGQPPMLTIQGSGGVRKTVQAGIAAIEALLPAANDCQRSPQPIAELMVALQCGGSDGWSGITANPMRGLAADEIVRQGGTVVLAETPEIYGAEHLLVRRAVSPEVGQKLVDTVHWWEDHARRVGGEINNNPSIGNKAGGLTTIYEKSLGAVAKGGSTPLTGVFGYAEPVTVRGFTFMDSPGYDPISVTGQVAGGCNLVLFTTGRGSAFGFKPTPSIKIATNTPMYEHMIDDMDLNAGKVLDGVSMRAVAEELLDLAIHVASGQPSKSEAQGIGESEFNPWSVGGLF
ncbi:MAG TPA: altronate dehydratase family protein [Aggregatilineales bacterium]|nr:altronate dehydratase family protein [Aggregatilineales bacterium]